MRWIKARMMNEVKVWFNRKIEVNFGGPAGYKTGVTTLILRQLYEDDLLSSSTSHALL